MNSLLVTPAFTLIELLIVITIIAIIWITSISWFSRMSDVQDTETIIATIDDTIDGFDRLITKHEVTSYEVIFESGSLGFMTNTDWYKKIHPLQYSFNFHTATGSITSTNTSTGIWEMNFSTHDAVSQVLTVPANSGVQYFNFPQNIQSRWYKIMSQVEWSSLNSYIIQYYSLHNVASIPENEIQLVGIMGWNNISYNSLKVQNILWKKILEGSGSSIDTLSQATLFFEKNGKELQMTIVP